MYYKKFDLWLRNNLKGYRDLNDDIRRVILFFAVAWSLFERRALGDGEIRKGIDEFVASRIPLNAELRPFNPAIQHFVERFVTDGATNEAFDALVKENQGFEDDIKPVLLGTDSSPRGQVLTLLYIIYCLRNNMIHGVKWEWGYHNQLQNLDHSIGVLNILLDEYAR